MAAGALAACDDPAGPGASLVTLSADTVAVGVGESRPLAATRDGSPAEVTWSSERPEVATVDPATGVVRGVALGEGVIVATPRSGDPARATVRVVTLAAAQLVAGTRHVCVLTGGGEALCWGNGQYGATGRPFASAEACVENAVPGPGSACSVVPRPVGDGTLRFRSLFTGDESTCGIATDGRTLCWGRTGGVVTAGGDDLCPGNTPCRLAPTPMAAPQRWKQIALSRGELFGVCGVTESGEAFCWGTDTQGRLGSGTLTDPGFRSPTQHPTPRPVAGGLRFQQISLGARHACGIVEGGAAYCWGSNGARQLGSAAPMETCWGISGGRTVVTVEFPCSATPVAVQGGLVFRQISVLMNMTCGLTTGGELFCWGDFGTGPGVTPPPSPEQPRRVFPDVRFSSFEMATPLLSNHPTVCGAATDGQGYCWSGDNRYGQQGNGTSSQTPTYPPIATRVLGGGYTRIATTEANACGITTEGGVNCWGSNQYGTLGRPEGSGRFGPNATPLPVRPAAR